MPKLQTFSQIKHVFGTENCSLYNLSKRKRSLCAQMRSGILPLHIESGRWVGTSQENTLCHFCDSLTHFSMKLIVFCIVRFIMIYH